MHHLDNFNRVRAHPINHDVGRPGYHQLPRSRNPSQPAHRRKLRKQCDAAKDLSIHTQRCRYIVFGKGVHNLRELLIRGRKPINPHALFL